MDPISDSDKGIAYEELANDSYESTGWLRFCLAAKRQFPLPAEYATVVIDLKDDLPKHARNDVVRANQDAYRVPCAHMLGLLSLHGKRADYPDALYAARDGFEFYAAFNEDGSKAGGFMLLRGHDWLTMCLAFGSIDAALGQAYYDHRATHEYIDLGGLNDGQTSPWWAAWRDKRKETAINAFKRKWGTACDVKLTQSRVRLCFAGFPDELLQEPL
jgi:hypothetical protein